MLVTYQLKINQNCGNSCGRILDRMPIVQEKQQRGRQILYLLRFDPEARVLLTLWSNQP